MVTCWERADLLALVGDVYCIFGTFPCGILGQVWYLIVLFPNLCLVALLGGNFVNIIPPGCPNKNKVLQYLS